MTYNLTFWTLWDELNRIFPERSCIDKNLLIAEVQPVGWVEGRNPTIKLSVRNFFSVI